MFNAPASPPSRLGDRALLGYSTRWYRVKEQALPASTKSRARPRPAPAPKRPGWLPERDDPRAEAILLAAFDAFMAHGFEGATMLDIATRARVSKLTLYAFFADKDGLLEALLAWGRARYEMDAREIAPSADPVEALRAYALSLARVTLRWQSLALARIVVAQHAVRPKLAEAHRAALGAQREQTLAPLVARLVAAGRIDPADAPAFMSDLVALLRGDYFYDGLLGARAAPSKAEIERHVARVLNRILRAYAPS